MIIQRINRTNPEKVFIVGRNDTATAFTQGAPVTFTFDATRDGLDLVAAKAGAAAKAHLVAGLADTAIGVSAYGLVQCYGVRTDADWIYRCSGGFHGMARGTMRRTES